MPQHSTMSWTTMIQAFARSGHIKAAKDLLDEQIQAFSEAGHLEEALSVFDAMAEHDLVSWNMILGAPAVNGHIEQARCLLEKMATPDAASWTVLIAAYAQRGHLMKAKEFFDKVPYANNGLGQDALELFQVMMLEGVKPSEITFIRNSGRMQPCWNGGQGTSNASFS